MVTPSCRLRNRIRGAGQRVRSRRLQSVVVQERLQRRRAFGNEPERQPSPARLDADLAVAPIPQFRPEQVYVGPPVPHDELPQVRIVDGPARCHRARAAAGADHPRARRMAALAFRRPRPVRRNGAVPDRHHADAFVPRVHLRLAAGGDSGRRRPIDAPDHRHDAVARQRRALQRRPLRLHAGVCRRRAQPAGVGAGTGRNAHRDSRCCVHRQLSFPDRLRRAPAATGQSRRQDRRRGRGDDQGGLSGAGDGADTRGCCDT